MSRPPSSSSRPSARTVRITPRAAARSRSPMMLFPSTVRSSRLTSTRASKRVAACTKRAAARACISSIFGTTTARSVTGLGAPPTRKPQPPLRRRVASRCPPCHGLVRDLMPPRLCIPAVFLEPPSDLQQARAGRPTRQLDKHRKIHACEDFDSIWFEARQAEIRWRATEHIGQHENTTRSPVLERPPGRFPLAHRSRRRAIQSRQPRIAAGLQRSPPPR